MKHMATAILVAIVLAAAAPNAQDPERLFKAAMNTELVEGNLRSAIEQYRKVAQSAPRPLAAQALLRMAQCYQKLGDLQARAVYERIVREFGDQRDTAAAARTRLTAMRPLATEPLVQTARRVWAGADAGWGGTPTVDGRYLTFANGATGDLAIRDLATDTTRLLTNTGGWVASGDYNNRSVISSDGRLVAYHWFVEATLSEELRVMRTDDPNSSRVLVRLQRPDYLEPLGLTPDGGHVVVQRRFARTTWQLGLVSTSDGAYRSLKSLDWRAPRGGSLSPDGRHFAYDLQTGDPGSPRDIFLLALDGSSETTAVTGPGDDTNPVWTADGSRLVFLSNRNGNPGLWTVSVENGRATGSPVLVKADTGSIWPLGVTKTGTLYYHVSGGQRQNVYTAPMESLKATGGPSLITEQFIDFSTGPSWSPDGQSLAFFSLRNRPTLVIRSLATGAERTVPLPQGLVIPFQAGPRWFPDNRSVLVLVSEPPGQAFYRVSTETGAANRLHRMTPGASSFVLSPDGRSIFWSVQRTTDEQPFSGVLMRYDIEEARETVLKRGEWFIAVALSPDGSQLAYLKSVRTESDRKGKEAPSLVEVIPAAGGPARQVYRDAVWYGGSRYNTLAWTPDGQSLMFVRDDGLLWRVPATGGEPQPMGLTIVGRLRGPSIHPNGRQIAFSTALTDDNEVWALENFLPVRREATTTGAPATLATRRILDQGRPWDRISPDGKSLVRADFTTNNLTLLDLATGKSRALTVEGVTTGKPNEQYPLASVFSRDGTRVAYEWYFESGYRSVLRTVRLGTAESPRTIIDNPDVQGISPTDWSPDGQWISTVIRRKDLTSQIGLVRVADGSLRVLKSVEWSRVGGLRFSPDSKSLAYHRPAQEGDFERDVFVIAIDGSRETVVASTPGEDIVLEWARDDRRLLVASDRGGSMSVWSVPVSGGTDTASYALVKSDIGMISSLGPTRDGTVFYNLLTPTSNIYVAAFDPTSEQLSQLTQPIQQFKGLNSSPEWSPDGTSLAWLSRRDVPAPINVTRNVIPLFSMETGKVTRELHPSVTYGLGRWVRDGRSFITRGVDPKGRSGIVKIDADTGDTSLVVSSETCSGVPVMAADGQSFFCYRSDKQIAQVNIATSAIIRTFPAEGQALSASSNGRFVAFAGNQGQSLNLLALDTGTVTRLPLPSLRILRSMSVDFTPDSRSIAFYGSVNSEEGMWLAPVDGGVPRRINVDVGAIFHWRFSTRGQVVFTIDGPGGRLETWKLENLVGSAETKSGR